MQSKQHNHNECRSVLCLICCKKVKGMRSIKTKHYLIVKEFIWKDFYEYNDRFLNVVCLDHRLLIEDL